MLTNNVVSFEQLGPDLQQLFCSAAANIQVTAVTFPSSISIPNLTLCRICLISGTSGCRCDECVDT